MRLLKKSLFQQITGTALEQSAQWTVSFLRIRV